MFHMPLSSHSSPVKWFLLRSHEKLVNGAVESDAKLIKVAQLLRGRLRIWIQVLTTTQKVNGDSQLHTTGLGGQERELKKTMEFKTTPYSFKR